MSFAVPFLIAMGVGAIGGFRGRVWIMVLPAAMPISSEMLFGSGRPITFDAILLGAFFYLLLGLLGALIGSLIRTAMTYIGGRPL
ncbi:hypothetical protein [Bosea thiooxidans]